MARKIIFLLFYLIVIPYAQAQKHPAVIPAPAEWESGNEYFLLTTKTQLVLTASTDVLDEIYYFQQYVQSVLGKPLSSSSGDNQIIIRDCLDCIGAESYKLLISKDKIIISIREKAGLFYAIQTLRQLIIADDNQEEIKLPALSVADYPAYEWRGMMLDVSRHFFSVEYLKKQIDLLALYKFNKLHLHLTDDQGWRIEIKKYPGLTQKGAWRTFNRQDSLCITQSEENPDFRIDPRFIINHNGQTIYGGYYTQDQIRDLVEYARQRHVEIIPEIDMPGHMMAAINAYPELSCTGEATWGKLFSVPLCPCNEEMYVFLENVLGEIISLFPSKYIHIGADEVEKDTWQEALNCRKLMKEKSFHSVEALQSYFVERIQAYLTSKGKEVIGWDEVLEGGINPDIHIMYWRDWVGGIPQKAVENGNKIIFSPGYPFYFSRADSSIYEVYHMKALRNSIPENKKHLIMGGQANIWTESIPSEARADYLIYPRLIALSEILWTPVAKQNWTSFKIRLGKQLDYLDVNDIKHSQLSNTLIPSMEVDTIAKEIRFILESEKVNPDIYYTLDGSMPTLQSEKYDSLIVIKESSEICAAIFNGYNIQEPVLRRKADYHKAIGKPVEYILPWHSSYPAGGEKSLTDGYRGGNRYNDGYWQGFTTDIHIVIDMEEITGLTYFSATFLQLTGPGVYMPEYLEVSLSDNGETFKKAFTIENDISEHQKQLTFKTFKGDLKGEKARYIRIYAKNKSPQRFMFVDEFVIN